jgi:hypothetical protein
MSVKEVKAAFNRNQFEIIRVEETVRRHVYTIRVPGDPLVQARWRKILNDFLLGTGEAARKKAKSKKAQKYTWQTDISKWFFEVGGVVKFSWRIMIMAVDQDGVSRGENMLAQCATDALREGIEVTSMPLVGRKEFKGKSTGGVYSMKEGAETLSRALGGGGAS